MNSAAIARQPQSPAVEAAASSFEYIPFLDGLRAISILLVLGFHELGPVSGWFGKQLNGWVGVDLFFLISGFLISSILLKERSQQGTFSLRNFYIRRWLRICPAYYTFLFLMLGWMVARGQDYFSSFAIAATYLTNIDMCAGWGLCTAASGLLHTWSLSVEEQFYLLWPGTLKLAGARALRVCFGIIALTYIWRTYLCVAGASWLRLGTGLDTKLDSIMLGVAVALLWTDARFRSSACRLFAHPFAQASVATALLVACHFLGHPAAEAQPLWFWSFKLPIVLTLMSVMLVSFLSNPGSLLAKLFSTKPLVLIGRLSYSLYLWHVIVNFPCTNDFFQTVGLHKKYLIELCRFAACFAAAASSYYLVELPFLKLKSKFN